MRGGTTPDAEFGDSTEQEAEIKLLIIDLMNSGDENMVRDCTLRNYSFDISIL